MTSSCKIIAIDNLSVGHSIKEIYHYSRASLLYSYASEYKRDQLV